MNRKNRQLIVIILIASSVVALYFFVRPEQQVEIDSGYRPVMGTFARLVAVAKDSNVAKKCIETAFAEIQKVDELMSDYKSDSEISKVNNEGLKRAIKVSKPTYEVLQRSVEFSKLSEGAFDITVGPLVDLWRSAEEANSVPAEAELAEARSRVGYEKLMLDANEMTVRFAVESMRIDLGGIAKGYAIDKAVEAMQSCGATGGMVDIGGDIRCFGIPPGGKTHWLIGLQNPTENFEFPAGAGSPLLVLKLTDAAIATSGGYRRFALIEGKKYSHIINHETGATVEGLSSVTIIADNATDADALATAVSVLGPEKGLSLIKKLPQTEAILITSQSKITRTLGAEKYIK